MHSVHHKVTLVYTFLDKWQPAFPHTFISPRNPAGTLEDIKHVNF